LALTANFFDFFVFRLQTKNMKQILLFLILTTLLQSCTTIDIAEQDAFDVKKTISQDFFDNHEYKQEKVSIQHTKNDYHLEGWYFTKPGNQQTVLYAGGNGFLMQTSRHIIPNLLKNDVDILFFNYSGYGNNKGEPSIDNLRQDGFSAFRFLTEEKNISDDDILIHGHSLGSVVASEIALNEEVSGLVMESPVTDAEDMVDELVPWFISLFVRFDIDEKLTQSSNLENMKKLDIPVMFAVGRKDQITPPELSEKLYQIAAEPKRIHIFEKGDHNNLPELKEYRKALREFYKKQL